MSGRESRRTEEAMPPQIIVTKESPRIVNEAIIEPVQTRFTVQEGPSRNQSHRSPLRSSALDIFGDKGEKVTGKRHFKNDSEDQIA